MEKNQIIKILSFILYAIVFLGISAVIILRFVGVIKQFDIEYIYLLLLVSAFALIPQFKKISIGDLSLEKETSTMEEADDKDVESTKEEENKELEEQLKNSVTKKKASDIKAKLLEAYCNKGNKSIAIEDFKENRQIVYSGDSINNDNPIFTWSLNKNGKEYLVEAKFTEINKAYYNKIYVMLSKIISYNKINDKNFKLVLLVQNLDDDNIGVSENAIDNFEDIFSPAIASRLLKIVRL